MVTPLVDSNCSKCDEIRFRNKGIYNLHENALRLKIIEMAAMKSEMQCAENKHRKAIKEYGLMGSYGVNAAEDSEENIELQQESLERASKEDSVEAATFVQEVVQKSG